jgi:YVTN family beta-propeller protein
LKIVNGHALCLLCALSSASPRVQAAQAPFASGDADIPISHRDRVYAAEQFSNTVSVVDPADNKLLGVIRLGDPQPGNFSPLYRGQLLVHGMGFSPDRKTLAVVSIGSNSVSFIDTATNTVRHTTYVGRSPHEAFYTQDGREIWVTVRGEDYVAVIDAASFLETRRIATPAGPGMSIFSPDGRFGFICSSFTPELVVVETRTHMIVSRQPQPSPFCPNIAATPDGEQVWYTLKDTGRTVVIQAKPPFKTLRVIDTGPITNHVNFVDNERGHFAYVTVGGTNQVLVIRRSDFQKESTIDVGDLPHGIWPSGDGKRVYVGLENQDALLAIDTLTNKVIARIPIGQAPQAVTYVPGAVATGDGLAGLQPLGVAGSDWSVELGDTERRSSVSRFDQGLIQVLQASVSGLQPKAPYLLALSDSADGQPPWDFLAAFVTNPAGAAIVNSTGPIRQLIVGDAPRVRRFWVIVKGTKDNPGALIQRQLQSEVTSPGN